MRNSHNYFNSVPFFSAALDFSSMYFKLGGVYRYFSNIYPDNSFRTYFKILSGPILCSFFYSLLNTTVTFTSHAAYHLQAVWSGGGVGGGETEGIMV